jgi:hypothetical protein
MIFVLAYGSYVPFMDEWEIVPALSGEQPVTLDWLWEQDSESRVPLPRVLLLGLYTVAGGGFHIGLVVNVLAFGTLACALILLAKRVRGHTSYLDAFLPLALLNLDQEVIFIGLGINIVTSTVLAGTVFLLIVRQGCEIALGRTVLAGSLIILLPLTGSTGAVLVPPLALWLCCLAAGQWRSRAPRARRNGLLVGGLASVAVLLVILYFGGFQRNPDDAKWQGVWPSLVTALQFLSMSFGQAAGHFLTNHPTAPFFGYGVVVLALLSAALLVLVWCKQPLERPRAIGLLMFLGAMGCLALSIGIARAARDPHAGYAPRYVTLAVPILYCIYFIWELYGPPDARRLVQMSLFTVTCMLVPLSWQETVSRGESHGEEMAKVEEDITAGTSPSVLAERHAGFLYGVQDDDPKRVERVAELLRMLQQAGIGPFAKLRNDAATAEAANTHQVLLPVVPIATNQMTWEDGVGKGSGEDPYLVFALPYLQRVHAVRLRYAYENTPGPASFQFFWRNSGRDDFAEERSVRLALDTGPGEKTITITVNDKIDQVRVDPDEKPCVFKLSEIVLLVPDASPAAGATAIEGSFDAIDKDQITGWAWDRTQPGQPVSVSIYDGGRLLSTVRADQLRQDLRDAGIGDGKHAFSCTTPAELKDGKAHTVRVRASGKEINESPKTVTLGNGAAMTHPTGRSQKPLPETSLSNEQVIGRVRQVVDRYCPPTATAIVVSKGDDDLLKLGGRKAWHFPRTAPNGRTQNPADGAAAIAQLEDQRAKGAEFLVIPSTAFWWLEFYKEFREHLDTRYQRIANDEGCIIYRLSHQTPRP